MSTVQITAAEVRQGDRWVGHGPTWVAQGDALPEADGAVVRFPTTTGVQVMAATQRLVVRR